jgi:glycosyltransferase involved in cell wall biosynthesis
MKWWLLDEAPIVGGAELFLLRLAVHLRSAGDDVAMLVPDGSPYAARVREAGLAVVDHPLAPPVPRSGALVARGVASTRRRLMAAERSGAVVVANTASAQAYAAVAAGTLRRRPAIVHLVHEQMTAARPSARFVFRHVGAVVATGANGAAAYRAALPGVEVGQLNNFLSEGAFVDAVPARVASPPVVGVLGRMIPEKGIVEAVEELAACGEAWSRARIAAPPQDAAYAARVQSAAAAHGLSDRVEFLDWAEAHAFLDGVDVLLVPSTGLEGQPTVILEGLARGRAVVVRAPMWSADYEGLPVARYASAPELGAALAAPPEATVATLAEARRRFGPEQALEALRAAAARAR